MPQEVPKTEMVADFKNQHDFQIFEKFSLSSNCPLSRHQPVRPPMEIRETKTKGKGLFASEFLEKDSVVAQLPPWKEYSHADLRQMFQVVSPRKIRQVLDHAYAYRGDQIVRLGLGRKV